MSVLRALNILSQLEDANLTAAELDALLSDPGRYSEWQVLCSMEKQFDRMMAEGVQDLVLGSTRAWSGLATGIRPFIYSPENLARVSPNAWGIYLPSDQYVTLANTRWANALGDTTKDWFQSTSTARPELDYLASPLNRQPSLRFTTDDYLGTAANFNQQVYTIFMVYRRNINPNNTMLLGVGSSSSSAQGFSVNGTGADTRVSAMNGTAMDAFVGSKAPVGVWQLSRFRRASATALFYSLNGEPEIAFPAASSVAIPAFNGLLWLGRGWVLFSEMNVAELWMVAGNGDAASPEIQRITSILKVKYGL